MTLIDASCLSEAHGDRLRDLRELFWNRTDEARHGYHEAKAAGASPAVLVHHRAKWMAWAAASVELRLAFDWTTVPSSTPREPKQLPMEQQARRRRHVLELVDRAQERTRGIDGIDDENDRLRGRDEGEPS